MAAGKLARWLSRQIVLADAAQLIVVLGGRSVGLESCRHLRIRQRHRDTIPEPCGNSCGSSGDQCIQYSDDGCHVHRSLE